MAVFLEYPLPDEVLISVVAYYVQHDEVSNVTAFCRRLFGEGAGLGMPVAIVTNLRHLEDETRQSWGMTAEEIRDRLTLFPYYAAFWPREKVDYVTALCLQMPEQRRSEHVPPRWSANALHTGVYRLGIRFCPTCWCEDDAKGGRRYWRRAHQLPGVVTCHVHGCTLSTIGTGAKGMFSRRQPCVGTFLDVPGTPFQHAARREVAVLSAAVLNEGAAALQLANYRARLDCLRLLGYGANNRHLLDETRLVRDVVHTFGKSYLELVRLFPKEPRSWIHDSTYSNRGRERVGNLTTILMDVFLSGVLRRVKDSPGPICPSAESANDPRHRLVIRDAPDGGFHCFCSCGYSFVFEEDAQRYNRRLQPTSAGPDYARAAALLDDKGWPRERIARVFGVSEENLAHWMRFQAEASGRKLCLARARLMVQWIELVYRCGAADRAPAEDIRLWRLVQKLWDVLPQSLTPLDCRD
ncbi:transcriptional regulator with XRE-family HTH domain [Paraburkholderia sp. HC6.4b]|uniref:TnsD family Tn7-like transposition protein n=1 Tax=unclassified Paraburkholderia TaxID=2615204 RepID=UPI001622ECE4|nr:MULTISPECIES: TnsD family Tn7-like transposition protein [unclassified Paraburkholderia]MBB5413407.1 transcriptional regulator with XRE-family HTH domain [Paraburkholderia sp. HC6.4b]MBB5455688.1 transcriptional regulator with XRE-family HTH domain [Paraburkholderia sp. Kb1A]